MRNWVSMLDHTPTDLAELVQIARQLKVGRCRERARALHEKILIMVFFNPSLRTRTSFEAAMLRFGGHAITLSVGGDTWNLEHRDGVVMDGDAAEHVREAAPVLSRYGDALAVRTFAGLRDARQDADDAVIRGFARHATVPLVNMESAVEHPCQGLADWMTLEEKLAGAGGASPSGTVSSLAGKRFVLTWAPHVKPLPMAVPHSALLAAAAAGMHVTVAHPPGYDLNPAIVDRARAWCRERDAEFRVTHEQREACRAADAVYVKSWGSGALYGQPALQRESFREHTGWCVDLPHLGRHAILMHCLPVRRNVVIADAALDDPRCAVVDQAENRLWTQAAILCRLMEQ
jgi:N-acetylornithine carbamoyltransferase